MESEEAKMSASHQAKEMTAAVCEVQTCQSSLIPASFLLGFGFGRILLGILLFMRRGGALFAGY